MSAEQGKLKWQLAHKTTPQAVHINDPKYVYTCQYCHVKFSQNSQYYRHIRDNHSAQWKEDTFQCNQCRVIFSKKMTLDVHCRTQHKVKSASRCESCSITFKSRYCLRRHIKLKQAMRETTCHKCDKICFSRDTLARHLSSKHINKYVSHKCDQCARHFKIKLSLSCHIDRIHPMTPL